MIQRFDQIAVDLPEPSGPNPTAAAAIQELIGGKFGEMSKLMNYTFQSFNFRGKDKYRPFYDLICNIAAEEYSHIEAVAATINLLLNGAVPRADRNKRARHSVVALTGCPSLVNAARFSGVSDRPSRRGHSSWYDRLRFGPNSL
jgi:Mn-containing catalase